MAKVRVPKELRPPAREFSGPFPGAKGTFRVRCFREPRHGDLYWSQYGYVNDSSGYPPERKVAGGPRVILERVK